MSAFVATCQYPRKIQRWKPPWETKSNKWIINSRQRESTLCYYYFQDHISLLLQVRYLSFSLIVFPWRGPPRPLSGLGCIACFRSMLGHMFGAQVPVGKREHHVNNWATATGVFQFRWQSHTQWSFQGGLVRPRFRVVSLFLVTHADLFL